jgi:taurine transport system permease protein
MTNVVATPAPAELATDEAPRLVKMRRFGAGEASTLPISLASGAVILAIWWIVADLRLVPHLFLPTPMEVATAAVSIFEDGYANATLFEHVGASLLRIFTAAAIAIVLGTPIGLMMGLNKWAKGVFDTPIEFYWPLPPLAYLPLMIIWLGIGETSKIALLSLAMFAPRRNFWRRTLSL